MITWIAYVMFVSMLLGVAALAAEKRAHLQRKVSRWYWIAAIVASLLIPTVIASVSIQVPNVFSPSVPQKILVLREATSSHLSPVSWVAGNASSHREYRNLDPLIKQLWLGLSGLLLAGLLASGLHLLWRKHQWAKGSLLQKPVLITRDVGPAVVGLINPQIVIPHWVTDLPVEQQKAVMAHEQSHLEAGDPLLLTIAIGLLVFMPWNLPLWWQLRRLRYAIEVDCDARVLKTGQSITSYGETLIAVGQRHSGYLGAVAGMSESTSFLEKRIRIMLTKPIHTWRLSATIFGCLSWGLVAVAAQVSPPNATALAAAHSEVSLPASTLDNYTGYYKFPDSAIMDVTLKNTQLYTQLTGQPAVEIYPKANAEFFLKVVDAQIRFILDNQGKATALVLHQNGADFTAPRIEPAEANSIKAAQSSKQQAPNPKSEAALRGLIAGLASGNPDYSTMNDAMAQATREQLPHLSAVINELGAIKTISFRSINAKGWDKFEVVHEHGSVDWKILLSDTGTITGAWVSK